MIVIRRFRDLPEAEVVNAALASSGIPSFLVNDHLIGVFWTYSQAVGGVGLEVFDTDAEDADEILRLNVSGRPAREPAARGHRKSRNGCAECRYDDRMLEYGARKTIALLLFTVYIPLFFWRTRECCRACGICRVVPFQVRAEILLAHAAAAMFFWLAMLPLLLTTAFIQGLVDKVR